MRKLVLALLLAVATAPSIEDRAAFVFLMGEVQSPPPKAFLVGQIGFKNLGSPLVRALQGASIHMGESRGNVVRVLNGVVEFGFEGELTQVSRDGCNIPVGIFFDPEANAGLIIPALLRLSMFEVFVRDRFGCAEFNLQISHLPEPVRYVPESFFEAPPSCALDMTECTLTSGAEEFPSEYLVKTAQIFYWFPKTTKTRTVLLSLQTRAESARIILEHGKASRSLTMSLDVATDVSFVVLVRNGDEEQSYQIQIGDQ